MADRDWTYWYAKIGDIRQAVVRQTRADVAYNLNEDFDEDGLSWTQPTELVDPGPLVSALATEIVEAIRQAQAQQQPIKGFGAPAGFDAVRVGDRLTGAFNVCHPEWRYWTVTAVSAECVRLDLHNHPDQYMSVTGRGFWEGVRPVYGWVEQATSNPAAASQADEDVPALFDEVKARDRVILGVNPGMLRRLVELTGAEWYRGQRINWRYREMEQASAITSVNREEWERWGAVYAK